MLTDDPFLLAIFENPDDLTSRLVYADWLEERGDPRADFLRLLVNLRSLSKGDERIPQLSARVQVLRRTLDRHWAAIFGDFDARVREVQTIRLRIRTYGSAPKNYNGATKVGPVERVLLVNAGWEYAGDGRSYFYVRRPAGTKAGDPVLDVEVPTDKDMARLAGHYRSKSESAVTFFGPWIVKYQEKPPTPGQIGSSRGAGEFEFGLGAPWSVRLYWEAGDDTSPRWCRNESNVIP